VRLVPLPYPPLHVEVTTPRLRLRGATDELLEELVPVVRDGIVGDDESPFDDPISHYEQPPTRQWRWLRAVWAARSRVEPAFWRLPLVVDVEGSIVGMQDLIAEDFPTFGAVTTFSWLEPRARGRGIGREMRSAILHLAFAGFGAREATSEAFLDNDASNAISRSLGYEENGVTWATRRGQPFQLRRWTLSRSRWEATQRTDITLSGVDECRRVFGLSDPLDQLRRSFAAVDALISGIGPHQWSAPTPCDEWDVRRVVEHLVGMNRVFAAILAGEAPPQRGDELPGEALTPAFRESAATLLDAFARPGVLGRSYTSPLGTATGRDRLLIRLYDLLAHGWDLARATGQVAHLPEDAAADSLSFVRNQLSDDARPGRFAAARTAPGTAPAIEQLVAFLGRELSAQV